MPQVAILLSTLIVVPIDSITRAYESSPLVSMVGGISALVSVLLLLLSWSRWCNDLAARAGSSASSCAG